MGMIRDFLNRTKIFRRIDDQKPKNMQLIHPIYLDVPMLVSFAAAMQDGVAFRSQITEQLFHKKSKRGAISSKVGIGSLFSQLLDASVAAESSTSSSDSKNQFKTESKSHTESSIAIILYDELSNNEDQLIKPNQLKEFNNIEAGALIELSGTVIKNAIDVIIDTMDAIEIMQRLTEQPKGKKKNQSQIQIQIMRNALDEDRKRTPISNMLLKCKQPNGLKAVITLRTENLRDLTLSELNKNEVKVVGKVTRIIPNGKSMSAFENYGMSIVNPDQLESIFEDLKSSDDISVDISEISVSGPAIQVLPLMIFV